MILDVNVKVSVRCSECGAKLDAVISMEPEDDYDYIIEVEPHPCSSLTLPVVDGRVCTCETYSDVPENHLSDCLYRTPPRK